MKHIVLKNKEEVGAYLGEMILKLVKEKKDAVLGLATGSTPIPTYAYIAEHRGEVSFKDVKTYNLDEYVECKVEKETYKAFMHDNLFSKIDIDEKNTHFPSEQDPESYDEAIEKAGGIDLQVLGIGRNGHIGFNEPNTPFTSKTHKTGLDASTREANKRFFGGDIDMVPTEAVTMGLSTIMKARTIVLISTDETKKEVINKLLSGEKSEAIPASILNDHPNVLILLTPESI